MEGSQDNLTTRSLLKGILATEPAQTAVKNPSKKYRRSPQPSTSYSRPPEDPSSPSLNLRSKMKERVRFSLQRPALKSSVQKKKLDRRSQGKQKSSALKGSGTLMDDLDDITPRTLLKKIIQNEDEVSIVVSQRPKEVAADDRNPEDSGTAQLSGVGIVSLSLSDLQDTQPIKMLRKKGRRRTLRVSEFEREVDKRLAKDTDNVNVSLDSFSSSSSLAKSYTFSRPFESKLDVSAAPESTFKGGLLRRPNKVYQVSLGDFEKGVEDKYQMLKGSQECFVQLTEEDRSDCSSNEIALINTKLYAQSLRKDANSTTSENRKQRGASKRRFSVQDEIKEANNELLETETRKRKSNRQSKGEKVITDSRGHHSKVTEDSKKVDDGGDDCEKGDGYAPGEVAEDEADGCVLSEVLDEHIEDEADGYASGEVAEDEADGYASGEVAEDEADGYASGEVAEDEADGYASGEVAADEADGYASGEVAADEADGYASGEVAADEADGYASGEVEEDEADGYASGEVEEDEADGYASGQVEDDLDEADDIRFEDQADDLMDDESYMQPNKSSLRHSRKSADVAGFSHTEWPARLSTRLSDGNPMKTSESIHLQTVPVSRSEEGSELLETSRDESLDLAMARGADKKKKDDELSFGELSDTSADIKFPRFASAVKPVAVRMKVQRTKSPKPKKSGSVLPRKQVKHIVSKHAQMRVSKDALEDVETCLDKYMTQLTRDLSAYAAHAKRKTIMRADMELLLIRQRLVTDRTSLNVLIEKHLPLNYRELLIPCAMSGNVVFPKIDVSSLK